MSEVLDIYKGCPITPTGYRMLVAQMPPMKETASGIIIPEGSDTERAQQLLARISQVVALGELCYQADHFYSFQERKANETGRLIEKGYNPITSPWCKVGDWVIHGTHTGNLWELEVDGVQVTYRILNDDEILGTVSNVDGLRAMMPLLQYSLSEG